MSTMFFMGLFFFAFDSAASASDCGEGSFKDDNWSDQKSAVSMTWEDTPGFNCADRIKSVSFTIKAGQYKGAENSCYSADWDQNGWRVWENWNSEEEKNEKDCKDISHVIVEWKCSCPIPTPTSPVDETSTPTATLPVDETSTPTATLPTATLPVDETSTPTATLPTATLPTATLPVDETSTPTITATPKRVNIGTIMPTAGAGAGGLTTTSTPIKGNWLILSLIGAIGFGGSFILPKYQDV